MMIVRVRKAADPFDPSDPFEEAEAESSPGSSIENDSGNSQSFDKNGPTKIKHYICATKPKWSSGARCWVSMLRYETKEGKEGVKPHRLGQDKKKRPTDVIIHDQKLPQC
jgi:hypothetical protein